MANNYVDLPSLSGGGGGSGVSSLNSLTGALSLIAGSNITITPAGSNITISSSGGGIASINSDSTSAQALTVGTSGTDFAIANPGSGSHVFNLPTASASNRGALSSTDWSTFNSKQATIGLAAFGSSPNANGLTLSGATLNMQPADGSNPGGVSILAQTFAGVKTFSSAPNLSSLTAASVLVLDGSKNIASNTNINIASLGITIDGGGVAPTTGVKGYIFVPYACTINSVTLLADQSGSCVIDIWKVAYASFPPLVGNSITASALPTLSSAQKNQDTTLTGWTTAVAAGDTLAFNVNSASTLTRVSLTLKVTKT